MGETKTPEETLTKPQQEEPQKETVEKSPTAGPSCPVRMESVERVSKLPVVEETMKIVINIYGKLRVCPSCEY
jgi:hypothetical protein